MATLRELNTQDLREETFAPYVRDCIVDFKAGMDAQFIGHVKAKHLEVSNKFLRERITKGEWDDDLKKIIFPSKASSIDGIAEMDLCRVIGDHLLHGSNGDEFDCLVEFLAWAKCDWGITKDLPKGDAFVSRLDMPQGVSGRLYDRDRRHDWRKGPIACTRIEVIITRNVKFWEDVVFYGRSRRKPFFVKTAYGVE